MDERECFICHGRAFTDAAPYRRCNECGHETLATSETQTFILNEPLTLAGVARTTMLDRFQCGAIERFGGTARDGRLVDIGSGSGRFLYRQRRNFARHCGIEITPEAIAFGTDTLGLNIVNSIEAVEGEIAIATAWHSLEHIPAAALEPLLRSVAAKLRPHGRFLVSVPNAASFQHRWFGRRFAFFDVPNHLHQFTPDSIHRLFTAHGFERVGQLISWPYNGFGYVQGLLNLAGGEHNYLYYRLKRRSARPSRARDAATFLLLPLVLPLAAGLSLLDACCRNRQGVLTYCFEKRG